jgi:tetratricopeptide (TPR) repeat protein
MRVCIAVSSFIGTLILMTSLITRHALKSDDQIADAKRLAAQLLRIGSADAAEPDAIDNLTQAITAISQKSSTDGRYGQALAFLRAGKPKEATWQLQLVAQQAVATANREKKRAANAYYDLGKIAGLADPKAARIAYAEAVRLDPDNTRFLLSHGYFEKVAGNLVEAEETYKRIMSIAEADRDERALWSVSIGLGDVASSRGDLAGAASEYAKAFTLAKHFVLLHPNGSRSLRELALSDHEIGTVDFARGDLEAAMMSFQNELSILMQLIPSHPTDVLLQKDLRVRWTRWVMPKQSLAILPTRRSSTGEA